MKTRNLILIGSLCYIFFLAILVPAASVLPLLNLPKSAINLNGVSGSLWSGSIDKVILKKNSLDSLQWALKPLSLLTGSISADITTQADGLPITTDIDYSLLSKSIFLNDLKSSFNASQLQEMLNLPFGKLSGKIRVNLNSVDITPKQLPLVNGNILWNNAKITLSETTSLGLLNIKLSSERTSGLSAIISNKQGELSINGDLKVLANQSYTLNIRLKPRANASSEVRSLLSLIAPKKVKSEHVIHRKGHLRDLGIRL